MTPAHVAENGNSTTNIFTESVYSIVLKSVFLPPTAESKINRHGFTQDNIHRVYELPFRIESDIKTTIFQYKIIVNIFSTKDSL